MSCASPTPPLYPQIRLYQNWLRETRGLSFADYDALWRWSTSDLDAFWQSIWDYFDVQSPRRIPPCWPRTPCPVRSGSRARR